MLSLKKVYGDELLQLALFLSLLRVHPDNYLEGNLYGSVNDFDLDNGTSWRSYSPNILRSNYIHPKSLNSVLLNYEREVFADLNSLGRYNRGSLNQNVTAYLLNIEGPGGTTTATTTSAPVQEAQPPQNHQENNDAADSSQNNNNENSEPGLELTQEVSEENQQIHNTLSSCNE